MTASRNQLLTSLGLPLLVFVLLGIAPIFMQPFALDVLTTGVIYGLMAMGLAVLIGQAGLPSLGHAAFAGVGGYASGLLVSESGGAILAIVVAAVVGGALAGLLGVMTLRSQGVYFLMISLALAELMHAAAIKSTRVGGDNGMRVTGGDVPLFGGGGLPPVAAAYWFALTVAVLVFVLLRVLVSSPLGEAVLATKDNAERMRALGYSVRALRMLALVASGATVAAGGALLAQKDAFVSPALLAPQTSILLLVMVLVGGGQSLLSTMLAGIGLIALRSWVSSSFGDMWVLVLGVVFVAAVYLLPRGLAGLLQRRRAGSPRAEVASEV